MKKAVCRLGGWFSLAHQTVLQCILCHIRCVFHGDLRAVA